MHINDTDDYYEDEEDLGPSKSQVKRDMNALQELGEALVALTPDKLATIPVGERLLKEIKECRRLKSNGAIRRQKQLIGKIMRTEDAEAIREALEALDSSSEIHIRLLHLVESWRDRLVNEEEDSVTEFVDAYPDTDVQQLRQVIRLAKKDIEKGKNTGQMKKLFRLIKLSVESVDG